jgi:cellulose biosynthesis protein BcsQ
MSASAAFKRSEILSPEVHQEIAPLVTGVDPVQRIHKGLRDLFQEVLIDCGSKDEAITLLQVADKVLIPLRHQILLLAKNNYEPVDTVHALVRTYNEIWYRLRKIESAHTLLRLDERTDDIHLGDEEDRVEYLPTWF